MAYYFLLKNSCHGTFLSSNLNPNTPSVNQSVEFFNLQHLLIRLKNYFKHVGLGAETHFWEGLVIHAYIHAILSCLMVHWCSKEPRMNYQLNSNSIDTFVIVLIL